MPISQAVPVSGTVQNEPVYLMVPQGPSVGKGCSIGKSEKPVLSTNMGAHRPSALSAGIKKVFYELTVNGGGTLRTIDVNENSTQIHLNISETGPYQFKAVALKEEGIWTKWIDPISFVVTE